MELATVLTGLESARTTYEKLVEEAATPLCEALSTFVRDNNILGIVWEQYTPHFNDGDECIFSVREPSLILQNLEDVDSPYDEENCIGDLSYINWDKIMGPDRPDWYEDIANLIEKVGLTKETFEKAQGLAQQLMNMEDVLKHAFGDHVCIKVTATGVEVYDCIHD